MVSTYNSKNLRALLSTESFGQMKFLMFFDFLPLRVLNHDSVKSLTDLPVSVVLGVNILYVRKFVLILEILNKIGYHFSIAPYKFFKETSFTYSIM